MSQQRGRPNVPDVATIHRAGGGYDAVTEFLHREIQADRLLVDRSGMRANFETSRPTFTLAVRQPCSFRVIHKCDHRILGVVIDQRA